MIIHRYSEYEEPEKPPFTLEDVVRAITELMMRHGLSFDEAFRNMLEQGLPINQFLKDSALDKILDDYIYMVEGMEEDLRREYDYEGYVNSLRHGFNDQAGHVAQLASRDPEKFEKLKEASRNRSGDLLTELFYSAMRENQDELSRALSKAQKMVDELDQAEAFHEKAGKDFSGKTSLDQPTARQLHKKYEALEKLRLELVEAREKGNLFGVDEERLKEALGDEEYQKFDKARQELLDKLAGMMEATGQVELDEDTGVFKLTPAAARKVGETVLKEIYSSLKNDGAGGHYTATQGEGSLEQVKTKPYEYGDSISHMDVPSSMINALVRKGGGGGALPIAIKPEDMEIHETRGAARNQAAVLIDMSGSMSRFGRFYNAKKMALALDGLIRAQYPEDSVSFIGFATFARRLPLSSIMELSPEPITVWGGGVSMKVDLTMHDSVSGQLRHVPRFFTNIQKGLEQARAALAAGHGKNKQIILITDGAPTAWHEGQSLVLSYPPVERGYKATLKEAMVCASEGISVNVFMLGSDFDTGYFGEDGFIERFMEITKGRIFYPNPGSLTEYVLADYMSNRRRIVEF